MKRELNPVEMPELPASERIKDFCEVALGYTEEQAIKEAQRCLQCKNPTCISGCPVEIDIKSFIKKITDKNYDEAIKIIKQKNNLPAICGRVCPQEKQCQMKCVLSKKNIPVRIGALERFVSDYERNKNKGKFEEEKFIKTTQKIKIAIIGSGPAGLTCGGVLSKTGKFDVTIYEALHYPGGVLSYGIPSFRLPREILEYELKYIRSLGVKIITDTVIGKVYSIKELFDMGYKAIFIGSGAGLPIFPNIDGENLCRIYSANEFLTRINFMHANKFPEYDTPLNLGDNIVVIGGGNTAMDAARSAIRLIRKNTAKVTVLYRRTETEMPARTEEIKHAKQEGINFMFLIQPLKFIGNQQNFVEGIECIKCQLGEPDSSGRRRPVPVKGTEFIFECDTVILALGLKANPLIPKFTPELKTNKKGDIIVNTDTMETSIENVYAGGDIICGEGTVIEAMGTAKKAAESIIKKFC